MTPSDGYSYGSISVRVRGIAVVINRDMRKCAWKRVTICALRSDHSDLGKRKRNVVAYSHIAVRILSWQ